MIDVLYWSTKEAKEIFVSIFSNIYQLVQNIQNQKGKLKVYQKMKKNADLKFCNNSNIENLIVFMADLLKFRMCKTEEFSADN